MYTLVCFSHFICPLFLFFFFSINDHKTWEPNLSQNQPAITLWAAMTNGSTALIYREHNRVIHTKVDAYYMYRERVKS